MAWMRVETVAFMSFSTGLSAQDRTAFMAYADSKHGGPDVRLEFGPIGPPWRVSR